MYVNEEIVTNRKKQVRKRKEKLGMRPGDTRIFAGRPPRLSLSCSAVPAKTETGSAPPASRAMARAVWPRVCSLSVPGDLGRTEVLTPSTDVGGSPPDLCFNKQRW